MGPNDGGGRGEGGAGTPLVFFLCFEEVFSWGGLGTLGKFPWGRVFYSKSTLHERFLSIGAHSIIGSQYVSKS